MRFLNKYKIHERIASAVKKLPTRVLKFKRPKWGKIRKKFLRYIDTRSLGRLVRNDRFKYWLIHKKWRQAHKRKISQYKELVSKFRIACLKKNRRDKNFLRWKLLSRPVRLRRKRWVKRIPRVRKTFKLYFSIDKTYFKNKTRLSQQFKKNLERKRYISSLYDTDPIKPKQLKKKITEKRTFIASRLVKSMYRIDIILWYLDLFPSSWAARHAVLNGHVTINSKKIKLNYMIKAGDIISLNLSTDMERFYNIRKMKMKFWRLNNLLPFIERDYFTNTFIVIKNWDELSANDIGLMFPKKTIGAFTDYKYN